METAEKLKRDWVRNHRWRGIVRPYTAESVLKLRGSVKIDYTLARLGSKNLWHLLNEEPFIRALGAVTGNQAVQMVHAGLKAIYASGWQVAADANSAGQTYPDQSLYPSDSVPTLVKRINNALQRADQMQHSGFVPIIADAEAGFGGALNVFEIMKAMIESGAAAVHLEDQLSSEKKCGHLGGKILISTKTAIRNLIAARLAADIMGVSTILIARTDANGAKLISNESDHYDSLFLRRQNTGDGFHLFRGCLDAAIARGLAYAPYADLIWCETSTPNLEEAKRFAEAIHAKFPNKLLAYNCSPSFNWRKYLDEAMIAKFQDELGRMGYKFQFITLAGFHALNNSIFELAKAYVTEGMPAYVQLQQKEFDNAKNGYQAVRHQEFVGTSYFDEVAKVISGRESSTTAMEGSTEKDQFK